MTELAIPDEIIDAELVDDTRYTRREFDQDLAEVKRGASLIAAARARVQEAERAQTIDMARRLYRMRNDPHQYWRGPGVNDTDNAFAQWAASEVGLVAGYIGQLLSTAAGLLVLESSSYSSNFPVPASAGQIRKLSSAYLRKLPDADKVIPNLWMQAVEDAGGRQPKQEVVESVVKRYVHDRKLVDQARADLSVEAREVAARLRVMFKQWVRMFDRDPVQARAFAAEIYHYGRTHG